MVSSKKTKKREEISESSSEDESSEDTTQDPRSKQIVEEDGESSDDSEDDSEENQTQSKIVSEETVPKKRKAPEDSSKKNKLLKNTKTSYMFWSQEERPKLKEEHPHYTFADIARVLGQRWKELSEEEKQPYIDLSNTDRDRFVTEKQKLQESGWLGVGDEDGKKRKKAKKEPKQAASGYQLFCKDKRDTLKSTHPDIKFGDYGKVLGSMWKQLSEDDKKPYEEQAKHAKVLFVEQREESQSKQHHEEDQSYGKNEIDSLLTALREKVRSRFLRSDVTFEEMTAMIETVAEKAPYELLKRLDNMPAS